MGTVERQWTVWMGPAKTLRNDLCCSDVSSKQAVSRHGDLGQKLCKKQPTLRSLTGLVMTAAALRRSQSLGP